MPTKAQLLNETVEHIDITAHNTVALVEQMGKMAFQARNLHNAATIYDKMLADTDCAVILCLSGSLISSGLKRVIVDLIANNMVDCVVSTGANIVDQDFFEALGYKHYRGTPFVDDRELQALHIDRIYDTFIDEDQLKDCDYTVGKIADALEPKAYSSREFIVEMGRWLVEQGQGDGSIVRTAYEKGVPIFCPAFSDCSAGFGLVYHQVQNPDMHLAIDTARDFREITQIKLHNKETGLVMIGGGVPKNFAQDIVVCAEVLGHDANMHKYAIQLTVADERDGALSGSTLKEACSWGKVDIVHEQMVFGEATITFPLLAGYVYHKGSWKSRNEKRFNEILNEVTASVK